MKRQVLLSVLAAIAIFAVTSTSEAGMFGRLHVIRGCAPCEPVACEPCQKVEPCQPACEPCQPICEPSCDDSCFRPIRPFSTFFHNLKAKLAAHHYSACAPECQPCEPVVEPCQPCEPVCEPCASPCGCGKGPFLPFGGFFLNLKAKLAAHAHASCNPCVEVQPCEPVCEPCHPCK